MMRYSKAVCKAASPSWLVVAVERDLRVLRSGYGERPRRYCAMTVWRN